MVINEWLVLMDKNYKQFVDKLNSYIRKFYLYQLMRGLMLFILLIIVYWGSISLLEYFSYFDPKIKLSIAIFTVLLTLFVFIYFIVKPFIKLLGFGKILTFYDVSTHLSKKYPEIKDRLINIIELSSEAHLNYSDELTKASIDQKINELKVFSFSDAIRLKDLKILFISFLGVFLLFSVWFISFPELFKESSVRLIRYQQKFEKPAPFTFLLENTDLEVIMGESIDLQLLCQGKEIPEMVYVNIGGNNFLMTKENDGFQYTIENVNSSFSIYFTDKKYVSEGYKISVINKPFVSEFTLDIQSPGYTGLQTQTLHNIGDLKIASGSTILWKFKTVDTDSLKIILSDSSKISGIRNGNAFEVKKTFLSNAEYRISIKNSRLKDENSLIYKIQVIPDLFPEIKVVQVSDSIDLRRFHFKGNIIDDYGFHKLAFVFNVEGKDSLINIPVTPYFLNQDFYYSFDFELVKSLGKSFKYYFAVYDNDYINHFKRTISETFTFSFPDYQEILAKENSDMNSIDQLLKKSSKLTEEIQLEFKNFKMKQINSNMSDYEKFQTVKDIVNKKNELEKVLEQIAQQNKDANNFLNSFSEDKAEILKKQQQIEELLNEVFSDELKKLFEEFNELAKQFDPKKFEQLSKEMNTGLNDLSKQLDKNMQLLKKLKVEQKVERVLDELKKLAVSEKQIQEDIKDKDNLIESGESEKKNFNHLDEIEKDYKDALDFNKTLEKPMNLFDTENEFKDIKENYQEILKEVEKKNRRKAADGIGENVKSLEELAFSIDQMLKSNKKKENKVNIEDIKQILDNLILGSFEQENLLKTLSKIDYNNPLINELKVKQKNMQRQVEFVKDSLYALSKRTPEISSIINKELLSLESNVGYSFDNLESGNIGGSRMYQQYGITAANNLALFLSEALDNIKKQEEADGSGEGDCEKPGGKGSKPSMGALKESQNSIKEQLQKMIDQMKSGDMGKMGKSIGQTIAQQEIMQQLIRDMLNGTTVGKEAKGQLQAIDQLLEQSRKDLINRNISNELINRQNLILSKLLEAEKSEIERDFEDERESKTANDIKKGNPEGYFEFNNKTKNENELLKRSNYQLRNFYDQKYNNFLNQIKN
ncbi:MAG: hypothetical protein Q8T04_04820 [Bacteroidota bacterium]|nr:hypothetical protein [Bacteroidota bacterium]